MMVKSLAKAWRNWKIAYAARMKQQDLGLKMSWNVADVHEIFAEKFLREPFEAGFKAAKKGVKNEVPVDKTMLG